MSSLSFSPDGASYLWIAGSGGRLTRRGHSQPLPAGTCAARFRSDGSAELVLTWSGNGIAMWDPASGTRTVIGGIYSDDGANVIGDWVGSALLTYYCMKSIHAKETDVPSFAHPWMLGP